MQGRLVELEVESAALAGNPLGDPARRLVLAYVPAGGSAGLPTVVFLHGFAGSARGWTNVSPFSPTVPERLDALVAAGELPPFVGLFPDGMTALGGTQWTNAPAVGRYQDYVADDVVRAIEARLGAIPLREARAVVGKSSGGYGALALGRDRPDAFSLLGERDPARGRAYEIVCVMTSEMTFAEQDIVRRRGIPVLYHPIAEFYGGRAVSVTMSSGGAGAVNYEQKPSKAEEKAGFGTPQLALAERAPFCRPGKDTTMAWIKLTVPGGNLIHINVEHVTSVRSDTQIPGAKAQLDLASGKLQGVQENVDQVMQLGIGGLDVVQGNDVPALRGHVCGRRDNGRPESRGRHRGRLLVGIRQRIRQVTGDSESCSLSVAPAARLSLFPADVEKMP